MRHFVSLRTVVVLVLVVGMGVMVRLPGAVACQCVERSLQQHYCDWSARYVAEVRVLNERVDGKYRVYDTEVLRVYKPKSSAVEKLHLYTPLQPSAMWDFLSGGCAVELRVGAAYFVVPFNQPAPHGHSRQVVTVCEFVRAAGALTPQQVAFLEQPDCEDVFDEPRSGAPNALPTPNPRHGESLCDHVSCPVHFHCEMRQPSYCIGSPACQPQSVCVANTEKV